MSMANSQGLGLVRRTSSFGRKRILILNHMDFDSIEVATPKKKQNLGAESVLCYEKSLLEALPQEVLIKILCGVDHDDLKRLFHVSKPIREAAVIAKKLHFEYSTPKKIPAFRCSLNLEEFPSSNYDEIEAPNAPKHSRVFRSRLTRKNLAAITVSLFPSSPSDGEQRHRQQPTNYLCR